MKDILIIIVEKDRRGLTKLNSRKVQIEEKGRPKILKYVIDRVGSHYEEALYIQPKTSKVELRVRDELRGWNL